MSPLDEDSWETQVVILGVKVVFAEVWQHYILFRSRDSGYRGRAG